jgi:hypothetical protein
MSTASEIPTSATSAGIVAISCSAAASGSAGLLGTV